MIIYRQKNFIAPLLAAAGTGGSLATGIEAVSGVIGGLGLAQGMSQMKQSEELAEKQEEQNRKMTKALNRIAENASSNPQAAQQAANIMSQKEFAIWNNMGGKYRAFKGFVKDLGNKENLKGFAKDVYSVAKPRAVPFAKVGLVSGSIGAATAYGVNKIIEKDAERIGMPIGGNNQQRTYGIAGSVLSGVKKLGTGTWNTVKNNKFEMGSTAAIGLVPGISYLTDRQQFLDQKKATGALQQKQYANIGNLYRSGVNAAKSMGSSIKKNWNTFKSHPGQSILGGLNTFTSFGNINRKAVNNFTNDLKNVGAKSGNPITQKVGGFLNKHKKTALTGALGVGTLGVAGTYELSDKLVRSGAKAVDKNAFKYEDSLNEDVSY